MAALVGGAITIAGVLGLGDGLTSAEADDVDPIIRAALTIEIVSRFLFFILLSNVLLMTLALCADIGLQPCAFSVKNRLNPCGNS